MIYIYIYIHGSKIYKSLLKVSPLIWAQKAYQKLSKKKNHANSQIWPNSKPKPA